ncbi:unnamed protein product [Calypogeia fissa]
MYKLAGGIVKVHTDEFRGCYLLGGGPCLQSEALAKIPHRKARGKREAFPLNQLPKRHSDKTLEPGGERQLGVLGTENEGRDARWFKMRVQEGQENHTNPTPRR